MVLKLFEFNNLWLTFLIKLTQFQNRVWELNKYKTDLFFEKTFDVPRKKIDGL